MEVVTSAGNGEGMPTSATDLRYGRRGGGWIPAGAGAPPAVICDVCGRPAYFGARHRECEQVTAERVGELGDGQLLLEL
jgi:hypothetical protein